MTDTRGDWAGRRLHFVGVGGAGMSGLALIAAFSGLLLAFLIYGLRVVDPADIARQLRGLHGFLVEKWQFDHLNEAMFVRPVLVVSRWFATFDRVVIDGFLHALTFATIDISRLDRRFDEGVIDGMVNTLADAVFAVGRSLRVIQTGNLRQYVMFIAIGVVALFMLLMMFFPQ